jgi:hypothetical protein
MPNREQRPVGEAARPVLHPEQRIAERNRRQEGEAPGDDGAMNRQARGELDEGEESEDRERQRDFEQVHRAEAALGAQHGLSGAELH